MRRNITRFHTIARGGAAVFMLFPCLSLSAAPKPELEDPTRSFQFEFVTDQPEESLEQYLLFIKKTSPGLDGLRAQYMVADILMARGLYQRAAEIFQQLSSVSLSDDYFNFSVLQKYADCQMRLGKYKEAAASYDHVRQGPVKALMPEAILGQAAAALALGDKDKAHLHFQELAAFYPSYKSQARLALPMGLILWEMRRYSDALGYLKQDAKNPASLYFTGLCQRALSKPGEAMAAFRKVLQEHGDTPWGARAKFELGETFYQQKDYALAGKTFEELARDNPAGEWRILALYRLACADVATKKYKTAEEKLWTLYKESRNNLLLPNVTYLLTESLAEQKKISQVVQLLQEQTKGQARSPESLYRLIWSLTALGRYEEAVSLANDFLASDWDLELTPKTLLVQGYAYEKLGRSPEAVATYQLVADHFSSTPHAARALQLMAMNYFRVKQYTPVITQVLHQWNDLPADVRKKRPEILFWIAEVHIALKNGAQARKYYQAFTEQAPPGHPLLVQAYQGLAVAGVEERRYADATVALQKAVQAAQDDGFQALAADLVLETANVHFNAKDYESAASAYRQFQKLAPDHAMGPFAMYQEGLSLHRSEYYTDAVAAWDKMLKAHPRDAKASEALFRTAKTRADMGQYAQAVKDYEGLIKGYGKSEFLKDAYLQIGQCHYNAGDYPKAIAAYTDFLTRYPKDEQAAQVVQLLQTAYYQAKMPPEEIEKRTQGQAKSAVLADIYWEEGAKLYNEKKYDKALAYFEKILFEFPASSLSSQAAFYRAEAIYLQEKYADAVPAYRNFLQYYPEDTQKSGAMFHLAVSLFNQKDYGASAVAFEDFARQFPDDPMAKNAALNAALCYSKAMEPDKTVQAYLNYAALYPDSEDLGSIYLQLGEFLEKTGQPLKAAEAYRRVPKSRPEYAQAMYTAGAACRKGGDPEAERQAYEELRTHSVKNDAYRIAALLQLAEMYLNKPDLTKALALYQDVAQNASDDQSVALAKEQIKVLQSANP